MRSNVGSKLTAMTTKDRLGIIFLGFIGYYLSSLLDFSGLVYISASLESMILYLYPTIVVILTAMLGRRGMHRFEVLALLIAYSGMGLMFLSDRSMMNADIIKGVTLVFAAAISFSVFLVVGQRVIQRLGPQRFTSYSMSVAAVFTLVHYFIEHGLQLHRLSLDFYLIGLFMAIFCTVLPAYMMNEGIHRIGANRAAIISSAGPVMTLVLAYFVLGEVLTPIQLGGMVMIVGSIYIVGKSP
jgi:drug/metabolite transporter (DMT)-like permease